MTTFTSGTIAERYGVPLYLDSTLREELFQVKSNEVLEASKFINLLLRKYYGCRTGLRCDVDFIQVARMKRIRRKFSNAVHKYAFANEVEYSSPCVRDTLVI